MTAVELSPHTPHHPHASSPMLSRTAALDLYSYVQQHPQHIDLSAYPTALLVEENVRCLSAHLLQFGAVESLGLANTLAAEAAVEMLMRVAEAGGASQLRHLSLKACQLSPLQLGRLLPVLKARAPLLTSLDLSGNALGDVAVEALAEWIPASLTALHVCSNSLSAAAVKKLLEALTAAKVTALATLELSDNRLDAKACDALRQLLTATDAGRTLTTLGLAHCGLDDVRAIAVAEALHASAVEVLDLTDNNCLLAFVFADSASRPVAFPASLRVLSVSMNACKQGGVVGFAQALHGCRERLEGLFLSRTLMGDAALSAFFSAVGALPSLRVLDLSHCQLTYRSGKLLSQQLPTFTQLEEVRLSDNMLEVEGVMDFACGLERMCRLTHLDLGSCYLGNCGAVAVVTSLLRGCAPLEHLDLSDNDINDAGMRDVCNLLSRLTCPKLRRFVLSRNACTKGTQHNLVEMMQGRQASCHVVADATPLEEVASCSSYSNSTSNTPSAANSLLD